MSTEEIMKLADAYAYETANACEGWPECYRKDAKAALKSALDALEAENLGLRLECQGLKAEVAEYKSYWKEATQKNRSLLEENADLALLADQYKVERDRLRANLHSAARIGGQP